MPLRAARTAVRAAPLLLITSLLAGCAVVDRDETGEPVTTYLRCEHPWPCGDEWPAGLIAPFGLAAPERVSIPMSDGIVLDAWVHRPDISTPVPALLWVSPYVAGCTHPLQSGSVTCGPDASELGALDAYIGVLGERLPEIPAAGFALVLVSVRGTGHSGGCFDFGGPTEQQDMAALVAWAAAQPWSNGRVGMYGLSYMGMTALEGAIGAPPALKTIVAGGVVSDVYQIPYTPQGAVASTVLAGSGFWSGMSALVAAPPLGTPADLATFAPAAPSRICPDQAAHQRAFGAGGALDRDPAYFEPRRHLDRVAKIQAAVLLVEGHHDIALPRHDDILWEAIDAPKRMIAGQWGHSFPDDDDLADHPNASSWPGLMLPWLDFWLKGIGDAPPGIGLVESQRSDGAWSATAAWPPPAARSVASYLTADGFADAPGDEPLAFRGIPHAEPPVCERADDAVVVSTPILEAPLGIAGNPFAYILLESDAPSGVVHLYLLDVEGEACDAPATRISEAAADLRFHAGNLAARDFPVGAPTPVRFDLWSADHVVAAGHRLVLVATGPSDSFGAAPPRIVLHPESHIILPVVDGAIAGGALLAEYPPRPFAPAT